MHGTPVCNENQPAVRPLGGRSSEEATRAVGAVRQSEQPEAAQKPGFWRRTWSRWLSVAHVIGTIQMMIILTVVYWVFVALLAIPAGIAADPLRLRRSRGATWLQRGEPGEALDLMRRQG